MIEFLIFLLIIAIGTIIAEGIALRIQIKNVETYENWVAMIQARIHQAYNSIRMADIRGSFESDDEVGEAFQKIKATIDDLQKYTNPEPE